ncbi:MAG: ABC transporter permease [Nanoarchaeota archaeon]|nr:ABC transporter permease [Nanoarchaeota archaeon]
MNKILNIMKKNFKFIISNKFSYLVLFLFPLLIILLMGVIYYNQENISIQIGTYNSNDDDLYNSYITKLSGDGFFVSKYESRYVCEDALKKGKIHACLFFSENFKIEDGKKNNIEILVDNSRSNIVKTVENMVLSSLNVKNKEIELFYLNKLLDLINTTKGTLDSNIQLSNEILELANELKEQNKKLESDSKKLNGEFGIDKLGFDEVLVLEEKLKEKIENLTIKVSEYQVRATIEADKMFDILDDSNVSSQDKKDITYNFNAIEGFINKINLETINLEKSSELKDLTSKLENLNSKLKSIKNRMNEAEKNINSKLKSNSESYLNIENKQKNISNSVQMRIEDIDKMDFKEAETFSNSIFLETKFLTSDKNSQITSLIPSIIASLLGVLSLFLAANLSFKDKNSKANVRNILSKTRSSTFIFANLFTIMGIVFVQVSLILIFYGVFLLDRSYLIPILSLLGYVLFLSIPFILIGFICGKIAKSENSYFMIIIGILFFFFLGSGKIIPLELLSNDKIIFILSTLNPYVLTESILRKLVLFKGSIIMIFSELIMMSIMILSLGILAWIIDSFQRRRFVYSIYAMMNFKEKKVIKSNFKFNLKKNNKFDEEDLVEFKKKIKGKGFNLTI